ncbi:hypothetical protein [Aquincola sp. J276]|uniref:hypothetical protein n=1 Tax=Aquincola sp. J276 TaxID=2898432 RepID=UPI002150EF8C|nr:hypothetical protein [Aquincola sp. J276]MCR5864509.1 hypothetical protein [Aquincola sp. J276]
MNAMSLPARRQRLISWPAMDCVQPTGGCSDSWQRSRYRERVLLRDGRSVLLRPAHHRDAALLQRFVAELSPRSRLLRFHGVVNGLSDAMARTLSTQVATRHVALVALADGPDGLPELCAERATRSAQISEATRPRWVSPLPTTGSTWASATRC